MSLKKITAADFEAIGNGIGDVKTATNAITNLDCNTKEVKQQGYIESLLFHGSENAVSTAQLVELTGFTVRGLQKAVENERRQGILILSNPTTGGYFLPSEGAAGKAEIEAFYNVKRAQAVSLLKTISAAKKALETIDGQQSIEG